MIIVYKNDCFAPVKLLGRESVRIIQIRVLKLYFESPLESRLLNEC